MKFANLKTLKFDSIRKNKVQNISYDITTNWGDKDYVDVIMHVDELCKSMIKSITNDSVYFEVIIQDKSIQNEKLYATLIANSLIGLIVKLPKEQRNERLSVPNPLNITFASLIGVLRAINYDTVVNIFNMLIIINGKKFMLFGGK